MYRGTAVEITFDELFLPEIIYTSIIKKSLIVTIVSPILNEPGKL